MPFNIFTSERNACSSVFVAVHGMPAILIKYNESSKLKPIGAYIDLENASFVALRAASSSKTLDSIQK